jgi:Protein of unknown function (DUF4199)
MKTYLTYGLVLTIAGALLNLALYFSGYHSDADKIGTAQNIGLCVGIVIPVVVIVLGIKARRAEVPATEEFGYGSALLAGVMIGLFSALFGIVTNYLYMNVINPGFSDVLVQAQMNKWEAAGLSSERIEQAEKMMRKMMNPAIQACFALIFVMLFSTIISLIAAAFLKRPASEEPPVSPA